MSQEKTVKAWALIYPNGEFSEIADVDYSDTLAIYEFENEARGHLDRSRELVPVTITYKVGE